LALLFEREGLLHAQRAPQGLGWGLGIWEQLAEQVLAGCVLSVAFGRPKALRD
jgi:hypothetical protein